MSAAKALAIAVSVSLAVTGVEALEPRAAAAVPMADPKPAKPVGSRPDVVSAVVSARAQGSRVEVESLRTESSTTWAEPNGLMSTEAHAAPIRFKDGSGAWRSVDLTLQKAPDGTVAPRGHRHGLRLGKRHGAAGQVFASATAGIGRSVEWVAPWRLPEPTLSGTKATYAEVQPGVDLVLEARRSGFEQDFVVKSRPAVAPVWRIPLRTKGLTAKPQADGSIRFVDGQGRVQSTIPVAYMWDAVVDEHTGEPVNRALVKVTVEQASAGRATLVISPDAGWFMDPARVFPVTVDPTYATGTVFPGFDTWVQTNVSTDQSASPELHVGHNGQWTGRSFLNFSTAAFKNKQILAAGLSLFESYSQSCTPSTFIARSAQLASTSARWTSQPLAGSQFGSLSVAKGFSAACPADRVTITITDLVKAWSTASYSAAGIALMAANESDANSWKRFHSSEAAAGDPFITYTWNRAPSVPALPTFFSAVAYAPFGGASALYTPYRRPFVSSKASDADGNNLRYEFEFHTSTTPTASTLKATCSSASYPSGTTAGCTPGVDLPDNTTIYVRSKSTDGFLDSAWSGWATVRAGTQTPAAPVVSCPSPHSNGSWQDNPPAGNVTCTITATGTGWSAPGYVRATVDGKPYVTNFPGGAAGQVKINPSADPAVAKTSVTLPNTAGLHTIKVQAESPAGRLSGATDYSFGYGGSNLTSPTVDPRVTTTGNVRIEAAGPPKGAGSTPTAKVRWRVSGYGSGSETIGWNDASSASLNVVDNGASGVVVTGIWNTAGETQDAQLDSDPNAAGIQSTALNDRLPVLLDMQVCLTYSTATQCTWSQKQVTVQRVPHAFGNGYPTADAGPGKVALWTGEFNTDETDVSVLGYTGDLSLSRSHSTYAGATNTVNGVFGPGWTAHFDGAEAGVAGLEVVDNSRIDGTIALVNGDGTGLVYEPPNGQRRTTAVFQTGTWVPADEDTQLDASRLTVSGAGASTTISYTEEDGTVTTFAVAAAPSATATALFRPAGIAEPGVASQTTYSYDGSGRVARILAPVPPGVTCPATGALNPGCRALRFDYGTSGSANGRLVGAWLDIYNPARSGGAGMDSVKVASYAYDASGRLSSVTDPRSNLTTAYGYNASNHLTTVTPPGVVPFQLGYATVDGREKLETVKRDRPAGDPTGGTATLARFVYNVTPTGAGLPDLSQASVDRWGQKATPSLGFAVFGPDHPVAGTPGADDWQYADLQYTDANGYTVNTAAYGAGNWQYTATDYNEQGNVIRQFDERALRLVIDGQVPAGATADQLASLTIYNSDIKNAAGDTVVTPAGTLITDTYGPARFAALRDGTVKWVRTHTKSLFDQGAPNTGINPATTLPYRLETTETAYAHDPGTGADLEVISRALTDYGAPVAGDADGWAMSLPGKTASDLDLDGAVSSGDIVNLTRYDSEGRVVETRQPTSNGADAGTTRTVHYTTAAHAAHPECGGKPYWAGLLCKSYRAAPPSTGPTLPSTTTTGYSYLLAPTTVVESSGAVTRTTSTSYLSDGRVQSAGTTVSGLVESTPNTSKHTTYDALTGDPTVVTAKNADQTITGTVTTGYDAWGRQTSYQPSGEQASTTVYDARGEVATVADANGATRYSYDGTDAAGKTERRGLVTKVEVIKGGATWSSSGAYDADSAMVIQKLPGGITQLTDVDNAGEPVGLRFTGQITTENGDGTQTVDPNGGWLSWSADNDPTGRTTREWTPDGAAFTGPADPGDVGDALPYDRSYSYDLAGRLTQVRDRTATTPGVDVTDPAQAPACITRSYGFDGNDNRLTKTTTPSDANGDCTTAGGTTVTRAFDTADRPSSGYVYDPLGRATTVPASDAPVPADGNIAINYFDNDLAKTIAQGGVTTSFTLDALDRRATETTTGSGSDDGTTVRHHTDTSDTPTWVTKGTTSERYAELIGGDLALTIDENDTGELTLANPHGDIVASVALATSGSTAAAITGWSSYDEYGIPGSSNTADTGAIDYGWLGTKQRATTGADLTLMGVRLYNPTTGLFTSLDPVEGGNANDYTYPSDPLNHVDLDGRQLDHRLGSNRGHGTFRWRYHEKSDYPGRGSRGTGGGSGFYTRKYGNSRSEIISMANRFKERKKREGFIVKMGKPRQAKKYNGRLDVTVTVYRKNRKTGKRGKIVEIKHFFRKNNYPRD